MRKLFLTIQLWIQSFTRRIVWMVLLAFGLLVTLGCYYFVYRFEPPLAMHMTAYGQIVLTLGFMMMGVELKREQQREHIDDIITVYSKRAALYPWCQILVFGFFALIVTLFIMAGCTIRMIYGGAPNLWVAQTLKYIVLLYTLPCWILAVWGLIIAHWNKGKGVYPLAMLGWLLTSTLCAEFTYYTREIGARNSSFFLNVLNMGINNFHYLGNFVLGAPIELPRWTVRINILMIIVAIFLCETTTHISRSQKRKRRYTLAFIMTYTILMIVFTHQRYSVFFTRFADPLDVRSYVSEKHDKYVPGELVSLIEYPSEKNITQSKTDINLLCTTQGIRAEVAMQATADKDLIGQAFTLYSDLVVDEVWVDGEKVEFDRSHDGLMVYFPKFKEKGDSIFFTFHYHGYSLPIYPANDTTVQLNRSFPWIPWPGLKSISIYSNFYEYNETEDFFIADWQRGDLVEYTLHYSGPGNLYTNLDASGQYLYHGVSGNGVSLYSGMISHNYNGVDIYMPANQYEWANYVVDGLLDAYDTLKDLCIRMDAQKVPDPPKSVLIVEMEPPVICGLITQQELYSWGSEWEVRQFSATSSQIGITRMIYEDSLDDYQSSPKVTAEFAVAYLLNPCTGYPIHVSHASTRNFAAWLSVYMRSRYFQEGDLERFTDIFSEDFVGRQVDFIREMEVPETPLTEEEISWIGDILGRMEAGQNFDEPFKTLYHRLLHRDNVTISDIIAQLYHHGGNL